MVDRKDCCASTWRIALQLLLVAPFLSFAQRQLPLIDTGQADQPDISQSSPPHILHDTPQLHPWNTLSSHLEETPSKFVFGDPSPPSFLQSQDSDTSPVLDSRFGTYDKDPKSSESQTSLGKNLGGLKFTESDTHPDLQFSIPGAHPSNRSPIGHAFKVDQPTIIQPISSPVAWVAARGSSQPFSGKFTGFISTNNISSIKDRNDNVHFNSIPSISDVLQQPDQQENPPTLTFKSNTPEYKVGNFIYQPIPNFNQSLPVIRSGIELPKSGLMIQSGPMSAIPYPTIAPSLFSSTQTGFIGFQFLTISPDINSKEPQKSRGYFRASSSSTTPQYFFPNIDLDATTEKPEIIPPNKLSTSINRFDISDIGHQTDNLDRSDIKEPDESLSSEDSTGRTFVDFAGVFSGVNSSVIIPTFRTLPNVDQSEIGAVSRLYPIRSSEKSSEPDLSSKISGIAPQQTGSLRSRAKPTKSSLSRQFRSSFNSRFPTPSTLLTSTTPKPLFISHIWNLNPVSSLAEIRPSNTHLQQNAPSKPSTLRFSETNSDSLTRQLGLSESLIEKIASNNVRRRPIASASLKESAQKSSLSDDGKIGRKSRPILNLQIENSNYRPPPVITGVPKNIDSDSPVLTAEQSEASVQSSSTQQTSSTKSQSSSNAGSTGNRNQGPYIPPPRLVPYNPNPYPIYPVTPNYNSYISTQLTPSPPGIRPTTTTKAPGTEPYTHGETTPVTPSPDTSPPDTQRPTPPETPSPPVTPEIPATQPPATAPPDTEPPATAPPDTEPPATAPPDTEPPATAPPDTEPPATAPPDTEPPATAPPDTEPPATAPPDTEQPSSSPPETAAPATEPITSPPATNPPDTAPPATVPPVVLTTEGYHNGLKGNPHAMCLDDSIMLIGKTWFPFTGKVFAQGRENVPSCVHVISTPIQQLNLTFPYEDCGDKIPAEKYRRSMFKVVIIMQFHESILNEHTVQSFVAQCMNQKIEYEQPDLPTRIDEALEELNITPIFLEKRAQMPQCIMRIVPESESEPHQYGPSNDEVVQDAFIGQKLRVEWSLMPASEAYGFLVKNCSVIDSLTGRSYQVIDNKGCSSDINIFGHPHYDIYHDLAIVHWHAFKVPDNSRLSIICNCQVCSDISDDDGNKACDEIPTPPFCPKFEKVDLSENHLLFDFAPEFSAASMVEDMNVQAAVRVFGKAEPIPHDAMMEMKESAARLYVTSARANGSVCVTKTVFALIVTFVALIFLVSAGLCIALYTLRNRRRKSNANSQLSSRSSTASSKRDCFEFNEVPSYEAQLQEINSTPKAPPHASKHNPKGRSPPPPDCVHSSKIRDHAMLLLSGRREHETDHCSSHPMRLLYDNFSGISSCGSTLGASTIGPRGVANSASLVPGGNEVKRAKDAEKVHRNNSNFNDINNNYYDNGGDNRQLSVCVPSSSHNLYEYALSASGSSNAP